MKKIPNQFINAVYVLSVKKFADRISHIRHELDKNEIAFEFIFDHDIEEIDKDYEIKIFGENCKMGQAQKSLVLKHICAWGKCIKYKHESILIFEDDVILNKNFAEHIIKVMATINKKTEDYLIFLGGADARVPKSYFLTSEPLFENPINTADGYITNYGACEKRINWLDKHIVNLPADHLLKQIDKELNIKQYWSSKPLVEQGSVFGMFTSTLDQKRMGKSNFHNLARYRLKILTRRVVPKIYYRLARIFGFFKKIYDK